MSVHSPRGLWMSGGTPLPGKMSGSHAALHTLPFLEPHEELQQNDMFCLLPTGGVASMSPEPTQPSSPVQDSAKVGYSPVTADSPIPNASATSGMLHESIQTHTSIWMQATTTSAGVHSCLQKYTGTGVLGTIIMKSCWCLPGCHGACHQ